MGSAGAEVLNVASKGVGSSLRFTPTTPPLNEKGGKEGGKVVLGEGALLWIFISRGKRILCNIEMEHLAPL